jgi:hypothetical protein
MTNKFKPGERIVRIESGGAMVCDGKTYGAPGAIRTVKGYDGSGDLIVEEHDGQWADCFFEYQRFKVGDTVRCVNPPIGTDKVKGTGWSLGTTFEVGEVRDDICFPKDGGCGVYFHALRLVKEGGAKMEFKKGDKIRPKKEFIGKHSKCGGVISEKWAGEIQYVYSTYVHTSTGWEIDKTEIELDVPSVEGVKMDMKIEDVKAENKKEAKRKFDAERMNAEVEFAKNALRNAQDALDALDRDIKVLQERKKLYLDVVAQFK